MKAALEKQLKRIGETFKKEVPEAPPPAEEVPPPSAQSIPALANAKAISYKQYGSGAHSDMSISDTTMEVLSKLRDTVSRGVTSAVSQVSSVLPGNPVTREYEVTRHIASAGPGLMWKVYEGVKKSTKQAASVFVFEKKQLERFPNRRDREIILETLKKGVHQLTRLRHPNILVVQHPLEESRDSIAFATEPVLASLANVLGSHENMPSPLPPTLCNYSLFEVEIKYGILQLCEGLAFLHGDVKMLHRNICPESILINSSGAWKIAGFDFCTPNQNTETSQPFWPFQEYDAGLPGEAQPNLDFLAPEYVLTQHVDTGSDLFSLGSLIFILFSHKKSLFQNNGSWESFRRHAYELDSLSLRDLECIPSDLREQVKMLLNPTSHLRPDAHQLIKVSYFEDVLVKTLSYLDALYQWDNLQKSQFYKGLPQILNNLPHRVNLHRVVPCLVKEFVNPPMIPFVLGSVLMVAENANKEEFVQYILPHLKPVMKIKEPIQILLLLLQRMELLLSKTPPSDVKSDVLPLVYHSLECDSPQILDLSLAIIPTFASLVDYPSMKNALLPRIKKLCINASLLSVRVNCLVCLGKLLDHLDKWLVLDDVLPLLPQIPSREPAVIMGIVGIYKLTVEHKKLGITKEILATKVLPFLLPLCIENGLTLNQFNALMTLVKDMFVRIETDQRAKIEQLQTIKDEQKNALETTLSAPKKDELIGGLPRENLGSTSATEALYQSLGLASFQDSTVAKAAEMGSASKTSSVSASPGIPPSAGLSLADKQRLAKEKEQQRRLEMEKPLQPKPSPIANRMEGPKDLTSQLIHSNLVMMGHKQPLAPAGFSSAPFRSSSTLGGNAPPPTWVPGITPAPQPQVMPFYSPRPSPGPVTHQIQFPPMAPLANSTSPPQTALSSFDIDDLLS